QLFVSLLPDRSDGRIAPARQPMMLRPRMRKTAAPSAADGRQRSHGTAREPIAGHTPAASSPAIGGAAHSTRWAGLEYLPRHSALSHRLAPAAVTRTRNDAIRISKHHHERARLRPERPSVATPLPEATSIEIHHRATARRRLVRHIVERPAERSRATPSAE